MALALDETQTILEEVTEAFTIQEEAKALRTVTECTQSVSTTVEAAREQMKQAIVALTQQSEELDTETKSMKENRQVQKRRLTSLKEDEVSLRETTIQLEKECQTLALETEKVSQKEAELIVLDEEAKTYSKKDIPKLNLYANITNIKWDYSARAASRVKGYVTHPATKSVRQFDLDPESQSKFSQINFLWESIVE